MSVSLHDRVCIVTGASKGLGRTLARHLVEAGARVGLLARRSAALNEAAAEFGDRALAVECDVGRAEAIGPAVTAVADRFGGLDVVVNNAAMITLARLGEAEPAEIEREVAVNLIGPMLISRAALPYLRARGGDLVFVSSESVRLPFPYLGTYASTKAGLEGFAAAMRAELAEDGIRVAVLRAGAIEGTGLNDQWPRDRQRAFFETITRTGHAAFAGRQPVAQATIAEALVAVLALPRDANVDFIEVRAR